MKLAVLLVVLLALAGCSAGDRSGQGGVSAEDSIKAYADSVLAAPPDTTAY